MAHVVGLARPASRGAARGERAAAERTAQDLRHHRQAVALVAAHVGRAAQGCQAALGMLEDVLHGGRGIRDRPTLSVHRPSRRQRLVQEVVDLDLVGGHGGCRHVQQKGFVVGGRRAEGDGVGAQHGHGAARGHHDDAIGAAGHQPHHAPLDRDPRIDARRAEMMGIADRYGAHAMLQRFVHGQVHCLGRDRIAQAAHAVDQRAGAAIAQNARARVQVQGAGPQLFFVGRQHGDPMRIDAQQIGSRHQARGNVRQVLCHAPCH